MRKRTFLKTAKRIVRKILNKEIYYQSFSLNGTRYSGQYDTSRLFYSFDIIGELNGTSFLDLGCNIGGLVFLAEQFGATKAVGVDISPESVRTARKIAERHGLKGHFFCEDVAEYVKKMDEFDVVVCMAVLYHVYAQIWKRHAGNKPLRVKHYRVLDELVRQSTSDCPEATREYNELVRVVLKKTKRRFICSFNDRSGLILRRPSEVASYFKSLDERVRDVEVFLPNLAEPQYVAVSIKLAPVDQVR